MPGEVASGGRDKQKEPMRQKGRPARHTGEGAARTCGTLMGPKLLQVNEGKLLGRQFQARFQEACARCAGITLSQEAAITVSNSANWSSYIFMLSGHFFHVKMTVLELRIKVPVLPQKQSCYML